MDWNFKVRVVRMWHATPRDKPNFLLSIETVLQDERRKTNTTIFWGEFVDEIMPHLHNLIDEPVIVVMQLIRAHKFQGVYSVQNRWNSSKLWINLDLPPVNDFKSRLGTVSEATPEILSHAISQRSLSISEELAAGTVQLKTVKELLDSEQFHKSVEEVAKNTFHCKKYGRDYQTATHRYKVQIKVMDNTGIVSLLLWDNEAITLIGKSASELKDCPLEELHFNIEEGSDAKKNSVYDNEKISPKKMYISKRGRLKSGGPISEVTDDVDQLSSNKTKKVIKKEKNP
ncbi:hypothetical protein CQW23_10108 [Capsicum baccatum]|uniref:Replication factor A C-terminal domain-containing protein n=1 Tax=Capsicum baccatum TaxID=33114 RepID=A0A2G2WYU5_CAPBA|nr:hypothetical protein CQW23_10108 [Capsicum baccatum]